VHDIGKNIVGVVLSCNNYEVIDLGVMVPAQKILDTAKERDVDIIGLSGLITPSLEEMAHLASEMQRQKFNVPLLIGGATTSRAHTAVKIEPNYSGPVVYVKDASRAVGVAQHLLSPEQKAGYVQQLREEYKQVREQHLGKQRKTEWLTLDQARANRQQLDWKRYKPAAPKLRGVAVFNDYPLDQIARYIDWTPFFHAWEMKGSYPKILKDKDKGAEAKKLFDDAQRVLRLMVKERWISARGVIGMFPANATGDDVTVYGDDGRRHELARLHFLRQQQQKPAGKPNRCLADFVAPKESGVKDYVGMFAVTAGIGADEKAAEFEHAHDDYHAIMVKVLADRLAEAFAELMHQRVRREFWGYAAKERLSNDELIQEKYKGIRPAPGYPACPDHLEKDTLWQLIEVEKRTGMKLTESRAMWPAASVSGIYFGHPDAGYFAVGRINRDQVVDYAKRKGMSLKEAERWLAPNLGYDPES